MEYRLLGRSGLKVSALSLGTMTFGRNSPDKPIGSVGPEEARRHIDLCIDHGVNLIDTANVYARGESEEIIGEALAGKRDTVVIATKARFNMHGRPNTAGNSRINLIAECERSLKRLRTDWIDLYQVHQWDGETPVEETVEALDQLVRSGKVRYVGCSNFSGWHVMKCLAAADRSDRQRFVGLQIHYTLQAREAEYELIPIALDQGLGVLVWSPLAGGLLSGKFRGGTGPEGSRHFNRAHREPPIHDEERLSAIIDTLVSVADARGVPAASVALAWLLGRPGVTSVIIGARNDAQFKENLAAADLKLSKEELGQLDKVSLPPLLYPYWHRAWSGQGPPLRRRSEPARSTPVVSRQAHPLRREAKRTSGVSSGSKMRRAGCVATDYVSLPTRRRANSRFNPSSPLRMT
jgi:aryl-alcohol dehydrogenase-like predicted oxidoreductase